MVTRPPSTADFRAGVADQVEHGADVADGRDPVENDAVASQESGRQSGQSGVFGAADGDGPLKRRAALN